MKRSKNYPLWELHTKRIKRWRCPWAPGWPDGGWKNIHRRGANSSEAEFTADDYDSPAVKNIKLKKKNEFQDSDKFIPYHGSQKADGRLSGQNNSWNSPCQRI